jgi:dihydroflavonol-4-reductase
MVMASVNPSNVFGPVLDDHHHTSTECYRTLLRAEVPGVSRTQINFVDVRNVADMLLAAMTLPEASGERFILNGASIPLLEFADILHKNFARLGYRVPNRVIPDMLVRLFCIIHPQDTIRCQIIWLEIQHLDGTYEVYIALEAASL